MLVRSIDRNRSIRPAHRFDRPAHVQPLEAHAGAGPSPGLVLPLMAFACRAFGFTAGKGHEREHFTARPMFSGF
jgi:hypothetical protein